MSFGSFFLGSVLMIIGFYMVYKTNWFLQNFGDLGQVLGIYGKDWASWKVFGIALIVLGFLIAFSLLQIFFFATIGNLFSFGRL